MHACCLVIGPDVEGQLARYDKNANEVDVVETCWSCEGRPSVPACGVCNGSGKKTHRRNPDGRWDYWRIGGRYRGVLPLKEGATSGALGALSWEWGHEPPHDWTGKADQALAGDVDWTTFFASETPYTFALCAEGVLRERSEWNGHEFIDFPNWPEFFRSIVERLDPSVPLTIVDYHS